MPVNVESLSLIEKQAYVSGEDLNLKFFFEPSRHMSHFADCPQANKFRKAKR